jgi:hypothetical protein
MRTFRGSARQTRHAFFAIKTLFAVVLRGALHHGVAALVVDAPVAVLAVNFRRVFLQKTGAARVF